MLEFSVQELEKCNPPPKMVVRPQGPATIQIPISESMTAAGPMPAQGPFNRGSLLESGRAPSRARTRSFQLRKLTGKWACSLKGPHEVPPTEKAYWKVGVIPQGPGVGPRKVRPTEEVYWNVFLPLHATFCSCHCMHCNTLTHMRNFSIRISRNIRHNDMCQQQADWKIRVAHLILMA